MILKDFELEDRNGLIGVRGKVIIKRDGKYYSVSIQKTWQFDRKDSSYYRLKCFKEMLKSFVQDSKNIDEKFVIGDESERVRDYPIAGKVELWKEVKW